MLSDAAAGRAKRDETTPAHGRATTKGCWTAATWSIAVLLLGYGLPARAQHFLPDDPVQVDHDDLAVETETTIAELELSTTYDVLKHSLFNHWPKGPVPPAMNVNTLGEVPDSSWFENRIGVRSMSIEELVRGATRGAGPDTSRPIDIVRGKVGGITPGFTMRDVRGDVYFVKVDPKTYPNLSTAADVISSRFFHALGYFVPENYVVYLDPALLRIHPDAKVSGGGAGKRPMPPDYLDTILRNAATRTDGHIRIVASKRLYGIPVGPHEYHGTRSDDPNDVFPHEHRRDLRGYRLLCAWLNHDDSRSLNSLDMLVGEAGSQFVKHYLLDFSSTLGAGSNAEREIAPQGRRAGNEYLIEFGPMLKTAFSLGLWERPWRKVRYQVYPEVGRIESDFFRPEKWRPEYPNPAFENMLPADAFWAGKLVFRFSDEAIRALVHTGAFTDLAAEKHLADTLIARRDKVLAYAFQQVNPLDGFEIVGKAPGQRLQYRHLGEEAGQGEAGGHEVQWFAFDNDTGESAALAGAAVVHGPSIAIPPADSAFLKVRIRGLESSRAAWRQAVDVFIRNTKSRSVVGIQREADCPPQVTCSDAPLLGGTPAARSGVTIMTTGAGTGTGTSEDSSKRGVP